MLTPRRFCFAFFLRHLSDCQAVKNFFKNTLVLNIKRNQQGCLRSKQPLVTAVRSASLYSGTRHTHTSRTYSAPPGFSTPFICILPRKHYPECAQTPADFDSLPS
ncbi:uncharacterized protein B0I36DRAFT_316006 [Microdochium trichocladiopsis]|uniref:Uncharacterized protein n=1 Tax=Microdochium trichocladiopsis TaxID=1682393 RepID=A0A9P9BUM9_9PEZI|nr:uncharacterized protein B0I36DRAFT_316006 [Microdochium trichocladiopsis]KAH7038322.1 hypothetical protein B0I36DRAFT_316006 [Microdochium trichocladiopsis]